MRIPRLFAVVATVVAALFALCLSTHSFARGWWMWTPGDHVDNSTQSMFVKGYHPSQPIPFSHKLHAGDRKMDCQYCHSAARRSITAGIPPLNTCAGCHKYVNTETENIKKVMDAYNKNEPMEWTKVNALPNYVQFAHNIHVQAKGPDGKPLLTCQTCHGPVETMTTAEQWAPLQMGWCISCHTQVKAPATATTPEVLLAPVTCNTCHF